MLTLCPLRLNSLSVSAAFCGIFLFKLQIFRDCLAGFCASMKQMKCLEAKRRCEDEQEVYDEQE